MHISQFLSHFNMTGKCYFAYILIHFVYSSFLKATKQEVQPNVVTSRDTLVPLYLPLCADGNWTPLVG